MIDSEDTKELHGRDYSIFDDIEEQKAALKELHERSYMILDKGDYEILLEEYYSEFDRLAHRLSFVTSSPNRSTTNPFGSDKKSVEKQKLPVQKERKTNKTTNSSPNVEDKKNVVTQYSNEKQSSAHYFFLKKSDESLGIANAVGLYDPITGSMVLKKGSIIPLNIPTVYRYTGTDIQRRMFIRKHCNTNSCSYVLRNDYVCNSPDDSTILILGYKDNGWNLWKDEKGFTLGQMYNVGKS